MANVRRLPAWQISRRLKKKGVRLVDVGERVGVSTSFVHDTIARRKPEGHEKAEEVWKVLEEVLA